MLTNPYSKAIITLVAFEVKPFMSISLKTLKQQHGKALEIDEVIDLNPLIKNHADIAQAAPFQFRGEAYQLADFYVVEGTIQGEITLKCSRCLTEFSHPVQLPLKLTFFEKNQGSIEGLDEMEEAGDVHEVEDQIDLLPHVAEEVLLHIDPVPLCHQECRGLCPQCGKDLNLETCNCKTETIDPRLADLAKFFDDDHEDGQSR